MAPHSSANAAGSSTNAHNPVTLSDEIAAKIKTSLASFLRRNESDILIPLNVEKYHDTTTPSKKEEKLEEIFSLMWQLNEQGLRDSSIGNTEQRAFPLSSALDAVLRDLIRHAEAQALQYVELGPEPAKTKYILRQFERNGADVQRYTCVDINPNSRETMFNELAEVLGEERVYYQQTLFSELPSVDYRVPDARNVVTMLGFEEGNEHPAVVANLLDEILEPGDYFLSEIQLLSRTDWSPIFNFYQSELMRRFSKVTLQRNVPGAESEYGVYLIPVALSPFGPPTMVAVTGETIIRGGGAFDGKLFVTNYCLKYSSDEYVRARQSIANLRVISQRETADGTVAFQLAQRV